MAAARKFLNYLGLVETPEYDDSQFSTSPMVGALPIHEDIRVSESVRMPMSSVAATVSSFAAPAGAPMATMSMTPSASAARGDSPRISMVHPQTYNDARSIGDDFRLGVPVIMNVNDMDLDSAKRLVDFAAGLAYGLRGACEKVAPGVFLLSPANYDLSAAARAQFAGSFFNQS